MVDILNYGNTYTTTVRGVNYTVDGSTLTYALPSIPLDYSNNYLLIMVDGTKYNSYIYPGVNGDIPNLCVDLTYYPTQSVEVNVLLTQPDEDKLVTLEEVKSFLMIRNPENDARFSNLIVYATGLIQSYCGRNFVTSNVITEYHDGGLPFVYVDNPPVNRVWSVSEYDGSQYVPMTAPPSDGGLPNVAANANSTAGFTYNSESGKVWKGFTTVQPSTTSAVQGFAPYARGIRIEYNGGYNVIPPDLKLCCLNIVKELHKGLDAQITRFNQEQIQQMPYTGGFPPHIRRVLDLYRIIV